MLCVEIQALFDVPLALNLHPEKILDTLQNCGVHRGLTPLLRLLPTTVLIIHDQVSVPISSISISQSVASGFDCLYNT